MRTRHGWCQWYGPLHIPSRREGVPTQAQAPVAARSTLRATNSIGHQLLATFQPQEVERRRILPRRSQPAAPPLADRVSARLTLPCHASEAEQDAEKPSGYPVMPVWRRLPDSPISCSQFLLLTAMEQHGNCSKGISCAQNFKPIRRLLPRDVETSNRCQWNSSSERHLPLLKARQGGGGCTSRY